MNRTRIKEIFLANGFKEKLQGEDPASGAGEGLYDLNPMSIWQLKRYWLPTAAI